MKKRNSSIELLRIIMMLQIIFLHVADYGDYKKNALLLGGKHELLFWLVWLLCRCPVYMFIIIMGYFMCDSNGMNWKRVGKVYIPMYVYAIIIPAAVMVSGSLALEWDDYARAFFPALSRTWYFMTLYLIILILSPYLNKLIHAMNKKEFLILLGILFFLFCIWQPLAGIEPVNEVISVKKIIATEMGKSLYDFIFMYLLGAFLKRYRFLPERLGGKWKNWMNLALFLALGLLQTGLVYLFPEITGIVPYNDNPVSVLQCIVLFRFFANMQFYSGVINVVSVCNLGIYMIHEHPLIRTILWDKIIRMGNLEFYQNKSYPFKIAAIVLAVYIGCGLLEYLRQRAGLLLRIVTKGKNHKE